ncbi:MAG: LysR family transcriptional regulator [Acidobacteria bacterium RIFCSPLOWO2_12_FULL_65_11]|nr:MAG: LysR family transcriptional regulator [Acidobacteria bacterium RIFCSPLOWO2_02_FULL_64_15]OFW28076.1 MAG: LysR family transcriptional regulator [Acidobacteria bacterium RIFCSPLOWO2_12_FULL_65_11]
MEWLNYHHLLYFWTVAREGTVARASKQLGLAQPTISGQLKTLEDTLGEKLFLRSGRRMVLTEMGQTVFRYADEIFAIGRELQETLKGRPASRPLRLAVGIANFVPKLVVYRLLQHVLNMPEPVRLVCREGQTERLLADLAVHRLDVVVADTPVAPTAKIRAFSHLLGECGVSFFGTEALATRYGEGFPQSLEGAPVLMPTETSALRRALDDWFHEQNIHPVVLGEFDDSTLLKVVGENGWALFPVPSAIAHDVTRQYGVRRIGQIDEVRVRYYAISVERRMSHPALVAILASARQELSG